jgi:hypothetical protein
MSNPPASSSAGQMSGMSVQGQGARPMLNQGRGEGQSQDQGSGTRAWIEDARKGGKVVDGGRRGAYDMQV